MGALGLCPSEDFSPCCLFWPEISSACCEAPLFCPHQTHPLLPGVSVPNACFRAQRCGCSEDILNAQVSRSTGSKALWSYQHGSWSPSGDPAWSPELPAPAGPVVSPFLYSTVSRQQ